VVGGYIINPENMKKTACLTIISSLLLCISCYSPGEESDPDRTSDPDLTPLSVFEDAFKNQKSNIQVKQVGSVTRVLSDDTVGDAHQRFIVKLENSQTLLIAHNIDIGQRVPGLIVGEKIKFYGEYEWNSEGGVVHWTHKDPSGAHIDGWIEYKRIKYQ
jgi:hypothetical protein